MSLCFSDSDLTGQNKIASSTDGSVELFGHGEGAFYKSMTLNIEGLNKYEPFWTSDRMLSIDITRENVDEEGGDEVIVVLSPGQGYGKEIHVIQKKMTNIGLIWSEVYFEDPYGIVLKNVEKNATSDGIEIITPFQSYKIPRKNISIPEGTKIEPSIWGAERFDVINGKLRSHHPVLAKFPHSVGEITVEYLYTGQMYIMESISFEYGERLINPY